MIIGHILSGTFLFKHLELLSYDMRAKLDTDNSILGKNLNHADKDIVVVAIDNASLKELLSHPHTWEKDVWKDVLSFIESGQPKAVLFDMVFEKTQDLPWYDITFAHTLRKYDNTILGTSLDNPLGKDNTFTKNIDLGDNDYIPTSTPLDVTIDSKKLDDAITYTTNAPVNDEYTQHNNMGVVNSVLDADYFVRKNQPIFKLVKNDRIYYMPSLAFAGFLKYMGEGGKIVVKNNKILYKGRVIPIDNQGIVNLNWHKMNRGYSYIPISKILLNKGRSSDIKPEFFKDKMVIIGKTATGREVSLNLINSSYLGPEANAVALDNFINDSIPNNKKSRKFISEVPKPLQILITAAACILVGFLVMVSKSAFIGCINALLSIFAYVFFCFWLFANPTSRVWLPIVVPIYYLTLTSGIVSAFKFYKETNKKNNIMNIFGKFVSPKVLAKVLKNPKDMELKNTRKHLTVLFCDVKDFSAMSEKYNPEKLIDNLNELFKEVVNIVFENNGTVDKFIGDCIMAYWGGDPMTSQDEAFLAVKTALEIKKRVSELKIENAKEGKIIFDVKIGINTGEALLGLVGTEKIMSYTAMGDTVNVAARLENACSKLNKDVLISKTTYSEAKDKIITLEVGDISVKGKNDKIKVYEPIGLAEGVVVESENSPDKGQLKEND